MGRLIEQLAPEYGFTIHARIDVNDDLAQSARAPMWPIEFTMPAAVVGNIETLAALGVPVVIGTTGWLIEMDQVRAAVERHRHRAWSGVPIFRSA